MSMPGEGDVTQAQLDALAGGDSSDSVGEVSAPEVDNTANVPVEEVASTTDFLTADYVYENLPTDFRNTKILDKMIAEVNARHTEALSKYEKYQPFLEVEPENLAYAHQIFQMMDSQEGAQKVFDALVKTYGFTTAQAAQAVGEVQQQIQQQEQIPEEELTEEQQKIRALEDQIAQITEAQTKQEQLVQQQLIVEQEKIFGDKLDAAMKKQVYTVDPTIVEDEIRHDDLVARILYKFDRNMKSGGNVSVEKMVSEAFQEHRKYNQNLYDRLKNQQPRSAPIIMNPTGSNPGGNHAFNVHDEKQREAEFVRRLEELKSLP